MAKINVELYSTLGCHLCDDATVLLQLVTQNVNIKYIEIAESDALVALYATRIPVLKRLDNARELAWPFDASMLINFIQ